MRRIRWRYPRHIITKVGKTAFHINHSYRQVQQALKALAETGNLKGIKRT